MVRLLLFFGCLLICLAPKAQEPIDIVYPGPESDDYNIRILKLALAPHEDKYRVKALGTWPPHGRSFKFLEEDKLIDIMWGSARVEREQRFSPIRFPLFKGLIGWRLSLVKSSQKDLFKSINSLEHFLKLKPGQYHNWSDTQILRGNNINVITSSSYEGLYGMLVKGRFDYFPRSILEVERNYQKHQGMPITIDDNILIRYPAAYYFYVNKNNTELAKDIKSGLEIALKNGSFDKLFNQEFGGLINQFNIEQRKIINLENPLLSVYTPIDRPELWIDPNSMSNQISIYASTH